MNISQFKTLLDNNKLKGFYIFTGEETGLMEHYIAKIEGKKININTPQLLMQLEHVALFKCNQKQIYILNEDLLICEEAKFEIVKKHLKKDILIIIFKTIDKRKKFFKSNAKNIIEFNRMNCDTFYSLINSQLPGIERNISDSICIRSNMDMRRIMSEIDKLKRVGKPITMELVDDLITPIPDDLIFEMIKAITHKEIKKSFKYLNDLYYHGESTQAILVLMYLNFRNIFMIQSYQTLSNTDIAGKTGMAIGQVYMGRDNINVYTLEQLIKIIKLIGNSYLYIPKGKIDQSLVVNNIIIRINKL